MLPWGLGVPLPLHSRLESFRGSLNSKPYLWLWFTFVCWCCCHRSVEIGRVVAWTGRLWPAQWSSSGLSLLCSLLPGLVHVPRLKLSSFVSMVVALDSHCCRLFRLSPAQAWVFVKFTLFLFSEAALGKEDTQVLCGLQSLLGDSFWCVNISQYLGWSVALSW